MEAAPSFKRRPGRPTNEEREERRKMMEENTARPPLRNDDPREAAKRRAAELRQHSRGSEDAADNFYIPEEAIPPFWSYQWKRHTVYGQEDPAYQIKIAQDGWTAVPASRHPEMMPLGSNAETIMRDGMILMECPTEIVEDRRREELRKARAQVAVKEAQLAGNPDGHFERNKPQIKKGYAPIEIPE